MPFLGFLLNENRENWNDQNYWNIKEQEYDHSKNDYHWPQAFSLGTVGKFEFARDALLVWSAILLLPSG